MELEDYEPVSPNVANPHPHPHPHPRLILTPTLTLTYLNPNPNQVPPNVEKEIMSKYKGNTGDEDDE